MVGNTFLLYLEVGNICYVGGGGWQQTLGSRWVAIALATPLFRGYQSLMIIFLATLLTVDRILRLIFCFVNVTVTESAVEEY